MPEGLGEERVYSGSCRDGVSVETGVTVSNGAEGSRPFICRPTSYGSTRHEYHRPRPWYSRLGSTRLAVSRSLRRLSISLSFPLSRASASSDAMFVFSRPSRAPPPNLHRNLSVRPPPIHSVFAGKAERLACRHSESERLGKSAQARRVRGRGSQTRGRTDGRIEAGRRECSLGRCS